MGGSVLFMKRLSSLGEALDTIGREQLIDTSQPSSLEPTGFSGRSSHSSIRMFCVEKRNFKVDVRRPHRLRFKLLLAAGRLG